MMPRPVALTVRVEGIPEALRRERRWVVWRYVLRDSRWTKVPYQPSGAFAKANDPATWSSFDDVLAAYRARRSDGVGFVLGDGWAGIDFDKCVADYDPQARSLFASAEAVGPFILALDRTNAPWEISPSGNGYKVFGRSLRVGGEINFSTDPPTFTTWTGARFLAITGHYQSTSTDPTVDISDLIDRWFPPAPALVLSSTREGYSLAAEATDDEILCAMIGGDDSDRIIALWRGETAAYGNDHSRADFALVAHLAWWTNFDADRIDRLFRQSGLYRPKWDHASYRKATIGKACR